MIGPRYLCSYHRQHSKEQSCGILRFPSQPIIASPSLDNFLNCPQVGGLAVSKAFHVSFFLELCYPCQQSRHPRDSPCSCRNFINLMVSTTSCLLQKHKDNLDPIATPFLVSILMLEHPCSTQADSIQQFFSDPMPFSG